MRQSSLRRALLFLYLSTLFLARSPLVGQEPTADAGKKVALLIGVRLYDGQLTNLEFTESDVNALNEVLRNDGYRVILMTQRNALRQKTLKLTPTAANIRRELKTLLDPEERTDKDTVVVAFSGHGVQLLGKNESYFCPQDADLDDPETLIPLRELYRQMGKCPAKMKVLFADACRAEPTKKGAKFAVNRVEKESEPQKMKPEGGVAAFFSCGPKQFSYESTELKHGLFFHHLIEGLKGKAANNKGEVTLEGLASYVKSEVKDQVKELAGRDAEQTPHLVGNLLGTVPLTTAAKEAVAPDPGTVQGYRGQNDKVLYFEVTGNTTGMVWGTEIYTDDSSLATAAVHAGVLKDGEKGVVKVTIVKGQDGYKGTANNGVTSQDYMPWDGSFTIARVRKLGGSYVEIQPDPGALDKFRGQNGKVFYFEVTARKDGEVYGTDVYTDDSPLAVAVVHAGVLKEGESGVVKVTILEGKGSYRDSTRHGVTSKSYGDWAGSFKVEAVGKR